MKLSSIHIGQRAAAGVALLGAIAYLGGHAVALQGEPCPLNTPCAEPTDVRKTVSNTSAPVTGSAPIVPAPMVTVEKFDLDKIAQSEGVTTDKITLIGAELSATLAITGGNVALHNINPNNNGCSPTWTFDIGATLSTPSALIPDLTVMGSYTDTAGLSPAASTTCPAEAQYEYQFTLTPTSDTDRFCTTDGPTLTGAFQESDGNTGDATDTISFTLDSVAPKDSGGLCGNICEIFRNFISAEVTVNYIYCIEGTPPDGGGEPCECLRSPHYRRPGSLLLYPEFDNRDGNVTVLTITNEDCIGGTNQSVDVEFWYIDKENCQHFDKTDTLTPCDTLTLLTNFHNPNQEQGYVYVFAKDEDGNPITWNHLIGQLLVISGFSAFDYSVNAVSFLGRTAEGAFTDLDNDGIRDLDAEEYDPAPDHITIPRFLGQDIAVEGRLIQSQLILIALSGGQAFHTTSIDFCVFNDNEELFSEEYSFFCWDKPYLRDIGGIFLNFVLKGTNHDPREIVGWPDDPSDPWPNQPARESGWMCLKGGVASSGTESIEDPAFYAVLVERLGSYSVADLPWECGQQLNGALLPNNILGDGDPIPANGDDQ